MKDIHLVAPCKCQFVAASIKAQEYILSCTHIHINHARRKSKMHSINMSTKHFYIVLALFYMYERVQLLEPYWLKTFVSFTSIHFELLKTACYTACCKKKPKFEHFQRICAAFSNNLFKTSRNNTILNFVGGRA